MKKILMIINFIRFPWEKGNSRFLYLLDKIDYKNNFVELITSNFYHGEKRHRNNFSKEKEKTPYKITLIDEPGYKKNVSLKRFYSHYMLSRNIEKYINNLDYKPDLIYCSIPSLDVSKVVAKYAEKNNIKFIIDIQDLWPEAFKMVFNVPLISNMIFYPMKKKADYAYSRADEIIAVSETYANRAMEVNKKCKNGKSVFLGTDLDFFDQCKKKHKKNFNDNIVRIAYIGTLGHSYDIRCIIDAIKVLNNRNINNIKFVIMGNGPLKNTFENYAKGKNVECDFTGRLDYPEMVGLLCSCDIAVNPISHGAAQSIINKVGDYAAAGLPVVSTQECLEYRNILEEYNAGLNCENNNIEDIANKIEMLIKDKKLRKKLGEGNRKLAEKKFDRKTTYKEIVKLIEEE